MCYDGNVKQHVPLALATTLALLSIFKMTLFLKSGKLFYFPCNETQI